MAEYTIKDLMEISGTTDRAIRQLFDKNKELSSIKDAHTIRRGTRVFYDETIYNWFVEKYNFKNAPTIDDNEGKAAIINNAPIVPDIYPPPSITAENQVEEELNAVKALLTDKIAAYDDLRLNYDTLKEANEALRGQITALTDKDTALQGQISALTERIAAQERDIMNKDAVIERLTMAHSAVSITLHRVEEEKHYLEAAKNMPLFQRIKNRLFGRKSITAPTITVDTTEENKAD